MEKRDGGPKLLSKMIKVADVTPQDSSPSAEKGIQKYCTGA
jgi:hypothetical protein